MAKDDERGDGLEHTGYRSGRVRIVGAEPAGRAAQRPDDPDPSQPDDGAGGEPEDQAPANTFVPPLPHWTEPATGEVPAILSRDLDRPDADPFAVPGPTWREEGSDWEAQGDDFDPSMLVGDKTGQGALDAGPSDRQPWVFDLPGSGRPGQILGDEDSEWGAEGDADWEELALAPAPPGWTGDDEDDGPITEVIPVVDGGAADEGASDPFGDAQGAFAVGGPDGRGDPEDERGPGRTPWADDRAVLEDIDDPMDGPRSRFHPLRAQQERRAASPERRLTHLPRRPTGADPLHPPKGPQGDEAPPRNVGAAIVSGVVLGGAALVAFKVGPAAALALVTVVVTMAAAEAYAAFRQGGYHPVTLLGLVATVSLMIAAYNKGEAALPLVLVLLLAFCFVWHLAGVEQTDAVRSTGTTLFVFGWVAVFGSFGALLLSPAIFPNRHGIAFLLGGVIAGVAYDVGALTFGAWLGRHPMAAVSPNKTWEGFVGGLLSSVVFSVVIVHMIHPWTVGKAAALGVVVSVVSTVGDLFESTVKRHLGRKDMGRLLPGHGGILDRVDGLLFVLPTTFYLVIAFHLR